ncbi:ribosome maturation factor RimP [Rhodococcus sp. HNM0569]|uniref:ribosome maturation factor RimP n=1 Tax=Rhodococcus sp. HNM0569 TaxID=2716340 RepID=UPI00146E1ABD|nr:ribosome maturation factor RimP [Rhodococcus sp. HNM0569]NLU81482.1 ribosome maturation factor RimP [Rhodococcus sp. HNM0569]
MPVPSKERVSELVSDVVERRGYDLEDVVVTLAGRHSAVRIMVDSDAGLELDAAAELSREISELFDTVSDFGESPYTLEVTSPGIGRPLTHERHWRRARGRKAKITLADETLVGRIGRLVDGPDGPVVDIVVRAKREPSVRPVALADIRRAEVDVEFAKPDPRELALSGDVQDGRVGAGEDPGTAPDDNSDDISQDGDERFDK